MKTRYHENGWVIFIDEDVRTLSDDEIKEVVRLTVSNMVVVFKKQTLTTEDQIRICSVMVKFNEPKVNVRNIFLLQMEFCA